MTRSNNRSFGASMGAGCVRGVVTDASGSIVESGVRTIPPSEDPLASSASITQEISRWFGHESPVMVVSDHTGSSSVDPYLLDDVRLVGEIDAVLAGLRTSGLVGDARTVIIVDVGRVGSRVHTVDSGTGEVFASARTDEFSGDTCDLAIVEHLMSTYGAAEKLSDSSVARVSRDATIAKELLSTTRSVDLSGPFVGNTVRLRSTVVDEVMAPSLAVLVALVSEALTPTVDGIAVVGGGANMPAVQRAIMAVTGVPVVVPPSPELFAAVGAARLSTVIPVRTPAAYDADPDTEVFAAVTPENVAALAAPAVLSVPAPFEAEAAAFAAEQPMAYAEAPAAPAEPRRPATKNSRRPRVAAYLGGCAVAAVALIGVLTAATASTGAESDARTASPSTVSASLVPTMAFSVPRTSTAPTSESTAAQSTTSDTQSSAAPVQAADPAVPPADSTTTGGDAVTRDRPTRTTTVAPTTTVDAPAPTFQAPNRPPQGGGGSASTTTKAATPTTTAPITTTKAPVATTTQPKPTTTSQAAPVTKSMTP